MVEPRLSNRVWMDLGLQRVQQELNGSANLNRVGNYEIIRKIGEGSFSSVYLAIHCMTRQEVVLKSADKSQLNLAAEIANLRMFNHPHIARMYEYIVLPDDVWLVLEYCGGYELYSHLVAHGHLRLPRVRKLCAQLAGAVAYVHSRNVAHRDLKLENVLLDGNGDVKLGDFGFTRSYLPRALLETVCGTESYMAPELLMHLKYHPEPADIWSLGVIFYAIIYGQLPFDDDMGPVATAHRVVEGEPSWELPFSSGEQSHTDEYGPMIQLLKSMLQKDPRKRPKAVEVLSHQGLGEYGSRQLAILEMPQPKLFATKAERRILKNMQGMNIDVRSVADAVASRKCDTLHGLWYTALDRQLEKERIRSGRSERSLSRVRKSWGSPTLSAKSIDAVEPALSLDVVDGYEKPPQIKPLDRFLSAFRRSGRKDLSQVERQEHRPLSSVLPSQIQEMAVTTPKKKVLPPANKSFGLSRSSSQHRPVSFISVGSDSPRNSSQLSRPKSSYSDASLLSQRSQISHASQLLVEASPEFVSISDSRLRARKLSSPIARRPSTASEEAAAHSSRLASLRHRFASRIEEE